MKSLNDPILDAQALCQIEPRTLEQLTSELEKLGWDYGIIEMVINIATGIYIQKDGDLFTSRDGNIRDVIDKVLKDNENKKTT